MTGEDGRGFNRALWYTIFAVGHPVLIGKQRVFRAQGQPPRCKLCLAPFGQSEGFGGTPDQPGPSNRNPRYCSMCDVFIRENPGGAKVRLSMVFTDVRDSTRLAEELELEEYVRRMNRFYAETTTVFVETDGFMMDVVGDEVFALYPAGFSGLAESDDAGVGESELVERRQRVAARKAADAARRLVAKGRGGAGAFSFGIGVHTAEVFIGTVRGAEEGISDVRVWGPEVIKTARLSSTAAGGEALFSEAACVAAGLDLEMPDRRELQLKGIRDTVPVRVLAT
jgi:adenylate cyclase